MARPTHSTDLVVPNAKGTSGSRCDGGCRTWLNHWRRNTGATRVACARNGCSGAAEVGAHVHFADRRRVTEAYVVGLCRACNHHLNDHVMVIDQRTSVVLARALPGCGD